jgi:2-desacetyl-2-hydroxyethyl bacteriochlorophyllide A dehydrogenase
LEGVLSLDVPEAEPQLRSPVRGERMRAAVLAAPRRMQIAQIDAPALGPGDVRVRLEGCGVCASNLGPWTGLPWLRYPFEPGAPGHEGWGRIEAMGEQVTGWRIGERVAFLGGRSYAERDVAPASALVRLPGSLDGRPFPGEALACAVNVFARSKVAAGQDVAIVGIGFLGAILTRLATRAGARVIAISRRPYALDVARRMGAAATVAMDDHARILDEVRGLSGGRGCERVIEAVGAQWPLDLASELTAERGRLVIAGYHQDGPRQVNMQLWNWRGLDVVNAHERDPQVYVRGMREAVRLVETGALDPEPLYTHELPLDELGTALDLAERRPDGFLKALVRL